jgi:hypothetical protein
VLDSSDLPRLGPIDPRYDHGMGRDPSDTQSVLDGIARRENLIKCKAGLVRTKAAPRPTKHLPNAVKYLTDRELDLLITALLEEAKRRGRSPVPTANSNQLTHARESVDSSMDERSLQADLVRLDRAVPIAGCVGSRNPCS